MTPQPQSLHDIIIVDDPAWPQVQDWLVAADRPVDVLAVDRSAGERTLLHLQVTTRSVLGAVALETGGILVDHGWLRLLGAGHPRLPGSLLTWNTTNAVPSGFLVVAHDAVGGFFALNGGAFEGASGNTFYFAPDTLVWDDLGMGYAAFVQWVLLGDLAAFYETLRWPTWKAETTALRPDQGFSFYPPLWAEGEPLANRSRRAVPMGELWQLHQKIAQELAGLPNGTQVRIDVAD